MSTNTSTKPSTSPALASIVDRLAAINASIDALNDESRALKARLIASGLRSVTGHLHRAQILAAGERELIDWQTIAKRCEPSRQLIAAHTRVIATPARVSLFDLN